MTAISAASQHGPKTWLTSRAVFPRLMSCRPGRGRSVTRPGPGRGGDHGTKAPEDRQPLRVGQVHVGMPVIHTVGVCGPAGLAYYASESMSDETVFRLYCNEIRNGAVE
jgi:hypothetical protein